MIERGKNILESNECRAARRRLPPALIGLLLLLGCSLDVDNLPENLLPVLLGDIVMNPDPSEISPQIEFGLKIVAEDADGDELHYIWTAESNSPTGGVASAGAWLNGSQADSVTWIAPDNFSDIESIDLTVQVYDFDIADAASTTRSFPVVIESGNLRVRVFDMEGNPASVHLVVDGQETSAEPHSDYLFEDLPWGIQSVYTLDSDAYYGAYEGYSQVTPPLTYEAFDGYPREIYNYPATEDLLNIYVVPKTSLLLPGTPEWFDSLGTPFPRHKTELQEAVDFCNAKSMDNLLVMPGNYALAQQAVNGGTAAVDLSGGDLVLQAYWHAVAVHDPDLAAEKAIPIELDASPGFNDFGFYLEGNTSATRIAGFRMRGAVSSGAYLYQASAVFDSLQFVDCGTTGIFFNGGASDVLSVTNTVCRGNDHGISVSGGLLQVDGLLVRDSLWYGIWLRDEAAAELARLTLVDNRIEGLFVDCGGPVHIQRCLFAFNGRGLFNLSDPQPVLDCNLFWANDYGDLLGADAGPEDIFEDPLFCDPEAGDWRLQEGSPALDAACGIIGAFGQCDTETRGGSR